MSDSFLGTLHSRINLPMEGDEIQIFPRTNRRAVKITYDFNRETTSYYEPSYLEGKNQYGYFLDDNHGFIEIETAYYAEGRELFIIKDSYANSLIPILAPHYEKIYVLDLRYYNGSLFSLMDKYVTDNRVSVLVMYNCIHFLEDFSYRSGNAVCPKNCRTPFPDPEDHNPWADSPPSEPIADRHNRLPMWSSDDPSCNRYTPPCVPGEWETDRSHVPPLSVP